MSAICRNNVLKGIASRAALSGSRPSAPLSAALSTRLGGKSSFCFSTTAEQVELNDSHPLVLLLQYNVAPIHHQPPLVYHLLRRGLDRQEAIDHFFLYILLVGPPRNLDENPRSRVFTSSFENTSHSLVRSRGIEKIHQKQATHEHVSFVAGSSSQFDVWSSTSS
jgi:hypothetical protein